MTSIREVAQLARVSTATVSNTINRPEVVLPATRDRVNAAIEELGFIPNQHARQLNGLSSPVLGLVVIDASNPFFTDIARAVESTASESDNVVILCNSGGSEAKEANFLRLLAGQRVRGILLTPARANDDEVARIARSPVPVVLLDHSSGPDFCSVSVDDIRGGRLAVDHLLDLGHRRIAFIGGANEIRQHADRFRGATEAITARGLDAAAALVRVQTDAIDTAAGAAAAASLTDLAERPTAVFCANDLLAFGVYRGLAHAGISVPREMSLMGYDDIDVAADWIVPMTSVRQPAADMGRTATRLLLEHSSGLGSHRHQQIVFQPSLVTRQSTAALA
jgi:LacI family transcriptional regulator